MTDANRLAALEAVADAVDVFRARLQFEEEHEDALLALWVAYDKLAALPAPAQGETVEVAVWEHPEGDLRLARIGSPADNWAAWTRLGTTLLPIRVEGGGE